MPVLTKVKDALAMRGKKYGGKPSVLVGYEAAYALAVHEDVEMKLRGQPRPSGIGEYWGPHGQAKFLETPARRNAAIYAAIVKDVLAKGGTMLQALGAAGAQLLRDSQQMCPVEYGNLRASGFVMEEK
jgi:hypothetical protein